MKRNTCGAIFVLGAVVFFCVDFVQAGTYKLEYPEGYGCCCKPNAFNFGYYKTGWREWPGEVRLDKTFPRSIGMEKLPTPAGQEIVPLPKAQPAVEKKQPSAPKTQENITPPPPQGLPSDILMPGTTEGKAWPSLENKGEKKSSEPSPDIINMPALPMEPGGGFNPLPSLPSDITSPTLEENEKPAKKESEEKGKKENDKQSQNGVKLQTPSIATT
ncbi:MAG: hypothetical protein ACWGMZ_02925, partial [Thermoguttaceae bacterium]